jgi:hypothetical protein
VLIKQFLKQNSGRTSPAIESIAGEYTTVSNFRRRRHMIQSEHMKSCLPAQKRFLMFKGPGSFKKIFKIGGNVDELKAYRLIPLTPPLLFHFTLPLICVADQDPNTLIRCMDPAPDPSITKQK